MRKFLYFVAAMIVLFLAGAVLYRMFERQLTEYALVPRGAFVDQPALAVNAYADPAMWYSRPGMSGADPSRYVPEVSDGQGNAPAGSTQPASTQPSSTVPGAPVLGDPATGTSPTPGPSPALPPRFVVFFVHPTSYIPVALTGEAQWNAALGDKEAESRARLFLRGMASPFAGSGSGAAQIWAPRYRQASFGAFLTDKPDAQLALDLAYRDVAQAFDEFVRQAPPDVPIVLAGHSQGALHVLTLLRRKVLGTPLEKRIAMVYSIGWPISLAHDLPRLGLPACETAQSSGCIMDWSSFAEPADPGMLLDRFATASGLDGEPRGQGPVLCVNPITGTRGGAAPASANLGTLKPSEDFSSGALIAGAVPAACDPTTGLLLIGDPPAMGDGVLPGNNYHVYDIPLFWANLRADVERRLTAWVAAHP